VYDLAIAGAGPVGAGAVNLCGVHGLTAVAFDREPDDYDLPHAAGMYDDVQRNVQRILHHAGVLDAVLPATSALEVRDGRRGAPRAGALAPRLRRRRQLRPRGLRHRLWDSLGHDCE
jgi:2-polyprenyl-6-methoxyphenol hydroxylase-like FAD-dependent oxidoreductase